MVTMKKGEHEPLLADTAHTYPASAPTHDEPSSAESTISSADASELLHSSHSRESRTSNIEGEYGSVGDPEGDDYVAKRRLWRKKNMCSAYFEDFKIVMCSSHPNVRWIVIISLLSSLAGSIWSGPLFAIFLYKITGNNTKVRFVYSAMVSGIINALCNGF